MSKENPLWGAPRIHGELLKLGYEIAESTVSKYMIRRQGPPSQTWRTFLRNHANAIAAIDLCVLPPCCARTVFGATRHLESFPLTPLITDVPKTIEPLATKNGNRIVVDYPPDLGTIHVDQTRLRQSLLNLASNANKFTEKGTVTIAAHGGQEDGRDWITLVVTDTGIGMTSEQMGKLFQEFPRLRPPPRENTVVRASGSRSANASVR
jgi:hypothetical protein